MYDLSSSNSKPVSNLRESLISLYLLALFIFKLHIRLCMDPSGFICWGLGGGARGCDVMYLEWRAQECSSGDTWSSCMTDSSVILNHLLCLTKPLCANLQNGNEFYCHDYLMR